MKPLQSVLLASIAIATPVYASTTYPLLNGSFESPALVLPPGTSFFNGVTSWSATSGVGTTRAGWGSLPAATEGLNIVYGNMSAFTLAQSVVGLQANTTYIFTVDLYPISTGSATTISFKNSTTSSILAAKFYRPSWNSSLEEFSLPASTWTTVSVTLNTATFPDLVGQTVNVSVDSGFMMVDNARVVYDGGATAGSPRAFYISNSAGSDANDGLSMATAWKSFAGANSRLLLPGDQVLLKRGDAWTDELHLQGGGLTSTPVVLGAYGSGNRPKISRSDILNDKCVTIENPSNWKVSALDLRTAKLGLYLRYNDSYNNQNVTVTDCYFENIIDDPANPTYDPSQHDYEYAWSTGLWLGGKVSTGNDALMVVDGVTVKNCGFKNCAQGFATNWYYPADNRSRVKNVVVEDCWSEADSGYTTNGALALFWVDGGFAKRVRTFSGGGTVSVGTTNGLVQHTINFTFQDSIFANCKRLGSTSPDGVGFDFEGNTDAVKFRNNVINDNDGAALLIIRSPSDSFPHTNVEISGNVFYNNCLNAQNSGQNAELRLTGSTNTGNVFNNGIYIAPSGTAGTPIWRTGNASRWASLNYISNRELQYSSVSTRPTAFEFNANGNFEGWTGFNQWSGTAVAGGSLSGTSSGNDPYAQSGATWINSHEQDRVEVRMSVTAGANAQLFFVTETDGTYDQAKSVAFAINPDGAMHSYVINLWDAATAPNVITALRLDPTDVSGATIAVDYVRALDRKSNSLPKIATTVSAMAFNATAGGVAPPTQSIDVANNGNGTLNLLATSSQLWLSATVPANASSAATISINPTALPAGTYNGTITFSDANSLNESVTVPVSLIVAPAPAGVDHWQIM